MRTRISFVLLIMMVMFAMLSVSLVQAQENQLGASLRFFQFLSLEDSYPGARNDAEFGIFRMTDHLQITSETSLEIHGVVDFSSPSLTSFSGLAVSRARHFFPLQAELADEDEYASEARLDRLNVSFDFGKAVLTVGRQPVTWGEGYFWPALDLFAPFSPEQIDRDYKSGVDAVKLNLPLGNLSELEITGGILGSSLKRDGAVGAQLRWNLGNVDLGFMGGGFHQDLVGGTFVSADIRGTGLRGEISFTSSGDERDRDLARECFWRGSVGILRQLTPSIALNSEFAFNGYGTGDSSKYYLWAVSDRLLRGDVNGYGRYYWGTSLSSQLHPLVQGTFTSLVNLSDKSVLMTPAFTWSISDNADFIGGGEFSFGEGLKEDPGRNENISEYGVVPVTIFAAIRIYF